MKSVVQFHFKSSTAGDFCKRLHDEFLKTGLKSTIISLSSEVPNRPERFGLGKKEKLVGTIEYKLNEYLTRKAIKEHGLFTYPILGVNVSKLPQVQAADAIYIHWIHHGFMNLLNIEQLAKLGKPVIIVLHDMWYMSGGCHYSFDCTGYTRQCQNCPVFSGAPQRSLATQGYAKKQKLYQKYKNIYFVSPSSWMHACAGRSSLLQDKPLYHIPNVLNREVFKPFGKKIAKEILNIEADEKMILFGAVSVDSPYKGWPYLAASLQHLHQNEASSKISVVVFGNGNEKVIGEAIPFPTRFMGRVNDEYSLALLYNAADIFLAPSLADNLPYTIFEALACGTPVVAFNTGGIPDLIQHQINGYLAEPKNAADLAQGIQYCLNENLEARPPAALDNELSIQKHLALLESALKTRN
jgi:glycosyltransferase involved in cell wall biosynthesis